jgi:hypothetical protein
VDKHVDLLGILYLVWGGLSLLLSIAVLLLGAGALALVPATQGSGFAAGFTALVFIALGLFLLAAGGVSTWTGSGLRKERPAARLVAIVLAVLYLFLLPFGTALGIYSLWVLLNDSVRTRFDQLGRTSAS